MHTWLWCWVIQDCDDGGRDDNDGDSDGYGGDDDGYGGDEDGGGDIEYPANHERLRDLAWKLRPLTAQKQKEKRKNHGYMMMIWRCNDDMRMILWWCDVVVQWLHKSVGEFSVYSENHDKRHPLMRLRLQQKLWKSNEYEWQNFIQYTFIVKLVERRNL